jgi:hypothetical protein
VLGRRILVALVGALVVSSLSACSNDETLSREQYVSRLDTMCESFATREREIGEPRTLEDLVEKGPRVLDAFEETIVDEVHDLKAPREIAAQADRLVELTDRQRDVLAELVEAAKRQDVAQLQELASENATLNEETNALARNLGARSCATN